MGALLVVGTPIGNLGDLSPRAVAALRAADVVACEDTRRTGTLLKHAGLSAPRLVRMDEHTEEAVTAGLLEAVRRDETVVVVTDAGMPGLSDPGGRLIDAALSEGVAVEVVPGPFAAMVAAVGSGLLDPAGRFAFEGFLPRKGGARRVLMEEMAGSRRVSVFYESPHRVRSTVEDLIEVCGAQRTVALCRELTKLHEETWRGPLVDARRHLQQMEPRGEYVIVLGAAPEVTEPSDEEISAALRRRLDAGDTRRDAALRAADELGVAPNRVKRLANRPA